MISRRCYTADIVRLKGYGYGSYWSIALIISALLPRMHSGG